MSFVFSSGVVEPEEVGLLSFSSSATGVAVLDEPLESAISNSDVSGFERRSCVPMSLFQR